MQSPVNIKFAHFDQCDATPATFTQSPEAVSQPLPSFTHLSRGLVPQVASASLSSGFCQPSPALAALLVQRNIMQFSVNPFSLMSYPARFSESVWQAKIFSPVLIS